MSVSEDLYDIALRSRLLRSLLREYVPNKKHPFSNPSDLSYVVSTIKTHKLLAEWAPQPLDQNLIDSWNSAVDLWVTRLLTLVSSNLPDKCWAGICLLGITCQECSSERFLSSYAVWLNNLLSQIQLPVAAHFVKAAACASISDLFTRLSGFANAKKDATSHAIRVIPPVLKLLNEDSSSAVLVEAVCLICTLINFFPLSVQRHYDDVEVAIASELLLGQGCASVLKKLGYCLSLLPKSRGDADTWSLLMDKILISTNHMLSIALYGFEEEARSTETMRALLPSGKESPDPLGGSEMIKKVSDLLARRPERLLGTRIPALMQCCCNLLTNPYPVMVSVPVRGILSLVERMLLVDCSLSQSSYELLSPNCYEFIHSEIPLLQLHSLEILAAVVEGLSGQTVPHVASMVRLLNEYLRRCKFPDLRRKAYLVVKVLLMSMGVGIAIHLSQDIINNVFIDLDILDAEKDGKSAGTHTKVHTGPRQKKRKLSSTEKSIQEQPANDGVEVGMPRNLTPLSVRIAALETLEALLTLGGSMRAESWRGNVDRLLINVATNACKLGCSEERRFLCSNDLTFSWADFQLAALRALLASLLSPARVRPPHLALSLKLFRRGAQETGTKIAEYCGHALLALEVLIHPRALPLLDLHSRPDEYKFHGRQISTYHTGTPGKGYGEPESEEDDLNGNWLGNDDGIEIQDTEMQQAAEDAERPWETAIDRSLDEPGLPSVEVASVPEKNEATVSASDLNENCVDDSNNHVLESPVGNTRDHRVEGVTPAAAADGRLENDTTLKNGLSGGNQGANSAPEDDKLNTIVNRISATLTQTERNERLGFESDNESIPDIVDGDPDSD